MVNNSSVPRSTGPILALDSAATGSSVALLGAGHRAQLTSPEIKSNEYLLELVDQLLSANGVEPQQLQALVYGEGPGSLIGVRVAASVVNALAYGWQKPIIGVSNLDALAHKAGSSLATRQVLALLDARMQQVYCGVYRSSASGWRRQGELRLLSPEQLPAADTSPAHIVGNAWQYLPRFPAAAFASWRYNDSEQLLAEALDLAELAASGAYPQQPQALPIYLRAAVPA